MAERGLREEESETARPARGCGERGEETSSLGRGQPSCGWRELPHRHTSAARLRNGGPGPLPPRGLAGLHSHGGDQVFPDVGPTVGLGDQLSRCADVSEPGGRGLGGAVLLGPGMGAAPGAPQVQGICCSLQGCAEGAHVLRGSGWGTGPPAALRVCRPPSLPRSEPPPSPSRQPGAPAETLQPVHTPSPS